MPRCVVPAAIVAVVQVLVPVPVPRTTAVPLSLHVTVLALVAAAMAVPNPGLVPLPVPLPVPMPVLVSARVPELEHGPLLLPIVVEVAVVAPEAGRLAETGLMPMSASLWSRFMGKRVRRVRLSDAGCGSRFLSPGGALPGQAGDFGLKRVDRRAMGLAGDCLAAGLVQHSPGQARAATNGAGRGAVRGTPPLGGATRLGALPSEGGSDCARVTGRVLRRVVLRDAAICCGGDTTGAGPGPKPRCRPTAVAGDAVWAYRVATSVAPSGLLVSEASELGGVLGTRGTLVEEGLGTGDEVCAVPGAARAAPEPSFAETRRREHGARDIMGPGLAPGTKARDKALDDVEIPQFGVLDCRLAPPGLLVSEASELGGVRGTRGGLMEEGLRIGDEVCAVVEGPKPGAGRTASEPSFADTGRREHGAVLGQGLAAVTKVWGRPLDDVESPQFGVRMAVPQRKAAPTLSCQARECAPKPSGHGCIAGKSEVQVSRCLGSHPFPHVFSVCWNITTLAAPSIEKRTSTPCWQHSVTGTQRRNPRVWHDRTMWVVVAPRNRQPYQLAHATLFVAGTAHGAPPVELAS